MKYLIELKERFGRECWILTAIAAAGLLLRIVYLWEYSCQVHSAFAIGADVMEYDLRAKELLAGRIFPETPEIHAPLYSFFLAMLYKIGQNSLTLVRSVQVLLNFGAYLAVIPLLKRLGASFRVQAAYLSAAMLVPVLFFHQAELISESLLAPLAIACLWLLWWGKSQKKGVFFAGCLAGMMILTHGLMIFFAMAELVFGICRKKWRETASFAAGIMLLILPVIAVKSWHYGYFTGVQGNSAYNLWIGHNPDATGGCYLRPGRMWRTPLNNVRHEAMLRNISENRVFLEKIGRFYLDEPGKAMLLPLKKIMLLLDPGEPIAGADPEALIRSTAVQAWGAGAFAVVLLLAAAGIYAAIRRRAGEYVHFYLLAGGTAAGLLLTVVAGRYRQGMMPGIILLAALGAAYFPWRKWSVGLLGLVAAAGMLLINFYAVDVRAEFDSIQGEAYYRRGEWERAAEFLERAEQKIDDPARFDNMLGAIAAKKGDFAGAEKRYRRAAELDPDFGEACVNLGNLYFYRPGMRNEALQWIRKGLERNAALHSGYNLLGVDAAQRREWKNAEKYFVLAVKYAPGHEGYIRNLALCRQIMAGTIRGTK